MEVEKATGAKTKFEKWRGLKEAAEATRERYEKTLTAKPEANIETIGSGFAQIFPKAWKVLLITIFGIIMVVIYVMQVLTAWEIPLNDETAKAEMSTTSVTPLKPEISNFSVS